MRLRASICNIIGRPRNAVTMPFAFNFLPEEDAAGERSWEGGSGNGNGTTETEDDHDAGTADHAGSGNGGSFFWLDDVESVLQSCVAQWDGEAVVHAESVDLDGHPAAPSAASTDLHRGLLRVREEDATTGVPLRYRGTDLVPGLYEGGLKVWECSLDLCRYLANRLPDDVLVGGHVLELGCGHGLPGCWVLKRALAGPHLQAGGRGGECRVVLADFNDFVLRDVTARNVVLNAMDVVGPGADRKALVSWLVDHVALGAGDWNCLSATLRRLREGDHQGDKIPLAVPRSGYFDCILAAETTYSERAAVETARFLSNHLTPGTGVAYVATKRYYFGVGGGTKCFCDALLSNRRTGDSQFEIDTLEVYDDGASNIRELLLVRRLS